MEKNDAADPDLSAAAPLGADMAGTLRRKRRAAGICRLAGR